MLYKPNKVINGEAVSSSNYALWTFDDGSGDPFIEGGSNPRHYQWEIEINITTQNHSSHITRVPRIYNGNDVIIGDWLVVKSSGTALKIVKIQNKTNNKIIVIAEDVFRYNNFRNPGQDGGGFIPTPSSVIICSLNQNNDPLIDPLPSDIGLRFYPNFVSRLKSLPIKGYELLNQSDNEFSIDDIISVDPNNNEFVKYSDAYPYIVGRVIEKGPKKDDFFVTPWSNIEVFDNTIADKGDIIYIDNNSEWTLTKSGMAIYICLRKNTKTQIQGKVINPTTEPGNVLVLNGIEVENVDGSLIGMIDAINSSSIDVTADSILRSTTTEKTAGLSYPRVAAFVSTPPVANINGVDVVFDITENGDIEVPAAPNLAIEQDIVDSINNANIPDIEARVLSTLEIEIFNTSGGTITVSNVSPDNNGNNIFSADSSTNSSTGILEGTYGPSSDFSIFLEKSDAGAIRMVNKSGNTGSILDDFGIYSVENGDKALLMNIEQGIRKGDVYSVTDNTQRMGLNVIVGDAAYVEDGGNGEWQYWLYSSSGWTLIATQDSARTDADTLSTILTHEENGTQYIGTVSNNSSVSSIIVEVREAFDGDPVLNIGDDEINNRLMNDDLIDLSSVGKYTFNPAHVYKDGGDTDLNAYFDNGNSTVGELKIIITYL